MILIWINRNIGIDLCMDFHVDNKKTIFFKITVQHGTDIIARVYLYIIKNDLHKEPYGLMEDVFVEPEHRGKGIGKQLIARVIEEAKKQGCYKLVAQSRHEKLEVHALYEKFGFRNHGINFRMDL